MSGIFLVPPDDELYKVDPNLRKLLVGWSGLRSNALDVK